MLNEEIVQINKFSKLHNGIDIIFCKTDYILNDFKTIGKLDHDIILITGNSDYAITDELCKIMPPNIKRWYAQNCLTNNENVHPIPMGIENKFDSIRSGHGISYPDRVSLKEQLLCRDNEIISTKMIYANFEIKTNIKHRSIVKNICVESNHIDWNSPSLSIKDFFNRILDYNMIVCPIGNGVDTHRLWEVLYSGRVPITIKVGDYKIYQLYKDLPIIVLNHIEELRDFNLIQDLYEKQLNKTLEKSFFSYWKKQILKG